MSAREHTNGARGAPSDRYDVIVVGGGPAGAAAATQLARAGFSVALFDKARFPRDKLCGGLLSDRSRRLIAEIFGASFEPPVETSCVHSRFFYGNALVKEVRGHRPMLLTMRRALDAAFLDRAGELGVDIHQGRTVAGIGADRRTVTLDDGSQVAADFIIGADGAASRVRKSVLPDAMDKHGFALGVEMEVPRASVDRECVAPEVHLGAVRWGYGWVFPKRDTLTVGVAGLSGRNDDMRGAFRRFARDVVGHVPEGKVPGYPIPFGNFLREPGVGNVLLAGDAAGFAEPITGEGIAFALQSGVHAAAAIEEARAHGTPARAAGAYARLCRPLVKLFADAKRFRVLTYSQAIEPYFVNALRVSDGAAPFFLEIIAANADYRDYARYIARCCVTRLPKVVTAFARRG